MTTKLTTFGVAVSCCMVCLATANLGPGTVRPATTNPGTLSPTTASLGPGTVRPATTNPGTLSPTTASLGPGTVRPATTSPGTLSPTTANLGPGTVRQASANHPGLDLTAVGKDNEDAELLLSSLYEFCDTYQTCNASAHVPAHVQPLLGCCFPCDCSDECFAVGNCCRDKVGNPRRTAEGEIVSKNGEVCSMVHPIDNQYVTYSYLLVAQCHPTYEGEAISKCLNPSSTTLRDIVPVYSDQTRLSYRNIHCARCNNQTDQLQSWTVYAISNHSAVFLTHGNMSFVLQEDGWKASMRPNTFPATTCYRQTPQDVCAGVRYPSVCTSAAKGLSFEEKLRVHACANTCELHEAKFCAFIHYDQPVTFSAYLMETAIDRIVSGPLSDPVVQPATSVNSPTLCPAGLTFYPVTKTCLRLACPLSYIKQYTTRKQQQTELHKGFLPQFSSSSSNQGTREELCTSVFRTVHGACLDYRIRVTVHTAELAANSSAHIELAKAHVKIQFGIHRVCEQSQTLKIEIVSHSSSGGVFAYNVRAVCVLHYSDSVHTLYVGLKNMLQKNEVEPSVQVESDTNGLSFNSFPLEGIGYLSYADSNINKNSCSIAIAMDELQFCRAVLFSPEEYHIRDRVMVLREGREFRSNEYVTRTSRDGTQYVQICLTTYMSRPITLSHGSRVSSTDWLFISPVIVYLYR